MFKEKRVMVTGSEGLIGKELVIQLKELGADVLHFDIKLGFDITDICIIEQFIEEYKPEYIFHLFGIKGNPKMTKERPVDFMGPMLQGDTNMILLAHKYKIKKFLYTSSIAVLNPETDKYPAWAKQTAENLIEALRIQGTETDFCIVRPSNVYGRFDNFKNPNAMVITSLISKSLQNRSLEVWGNGEEIRDFINAKDIARGMILTMEKMPKVPINLCSGKGYKIKEVVEAIKENKPDLKVVYTNQQIGSKSRVMASNGQIIGFKPEIELKEGIKEIWKSLT